MTISAIKDPAAWTIYTGGGSNQTLLGRVTFSPEPAPGTYIFTPTSSDTAISAAVMRAIANKLDELNTP